MYVFVASIVICIQEVLSFSIIPSQHGFSSTTPHSQRYSKDMSISMGIQPFNPFTARSKKSKIRWYESELQYFYDFVESQPLLTTEQEQQYGKALKMYVQVEKLRNKLQLAAGPDHIITNEDLSRNMNTTTDVLERMLNFAEISRTKLLNGNLRLVLAVVSRYRTTTIPNAELIAEGTRGLSRAVLRYDYSKGFRFATYATWYVHQAVSEYVRWRRHPTKIPSRYIMLYRKMKQFSIEFSNEMKRSPTVNEIAHALNQPQYDVMKVMTMQQYPVLTSSLVSTKESYKGDNKDKVIEELLVSTFKVPSKQTDSKDLRRDMEKLMLSNLNDVERDVLRLRLGLDDGRSKPVKEVGKRFKISWKQVRTVEKEALSKLRTSEEISSFVDSYHSV